MKKGIDKTEKRTLLFNLSFNELWTILQYHFDMDRMCSVALAEIVSRSRKEDDEEDSFSALKYLQAASIASKIDGLKDFYNHYSQAVNNNTDDIEIREKMLSDKITILMNEIHEFGFILFVEKFTYSLIYMETKRAIEDINSAFGCAISLYHTFSAYNL